METLNQGDVVITSKGRFGTIQSIRDKRADVKIGSKIYEIYLKELIKADSAKSLEVEYCDTFSPFAEPQKEIIYISKRLVLYDFNNPMSNAILEECKSRLTKRVGKAVLIIKINLV